MRLLLGLSMLVSVLAASFQDASLVQDTSFIQDSPLNVTVESIGNTALRASITNTGSVPLKLLKTGSILDSSPIERAEIFSGSDQVAFDGIRVSVSKQNISEDAFQTLQAGETTVVEWDPATVHDLSNGGEVDFVVRGSFLTADAQNNDITGEIPFSAEVLHSTINGPAAAKVRRSFHETLQASLKRSAVQNDCTGAKGRANSLAFQNCAQLATAASQAALTGNGAKLVEYFNSQSTSVRQNVAGAFTKIATECNSTLNGVAEQFCTDVLQSCSPGVLAYTIPSKSVMVSCGIYYGQLPALETRCHRQDQATTTLHEVTHLRQIAGTNDFAYGYGLATQLGTNQALGNADTYALFANAIAVGC